MLILNKFEFFNDIRYRANAIARGREEARTRARARGREGREREREDAVEQLPRLSPPRNKRVGV